MKVKAIKFVAFVMYYLGITRLFYLLNFKAKRIITFHNVIPHQLLPCGRNIGLTDTEESFRFKIRQIKRFLKITVDLFDGVGATITFDDGYKNQSEIAGRILNEEGNIPAIIFASGRNIGNVDPSKALIVDLLMHWTSLAPNGLYRLTSKDGVNIDFELTFINREQIWKKIIWPNFTKDGESKGRCLLLQLDKLYSIKKVLKKCCPDYLRLRLTGINNYDIITLQNKGWLIGWHTQEHFPLSKLPDVSSLEYEIGSCPDYMKKVVFSYPYGEEASVDKQCIEFAKANGFPCAVSNLPDSDNWSGFFLPRFTLSNNMYLLHFELSGLKYFIKKKKLLPKININEQNCIL